MASTVGASPLLGNTIAEHVMPLAGATGLVASASTSAGANSAPMTDSNLTVATLPGLSIALEVKASDADRDALSFDASDPLHGKVSSGTGGVVVYTPDPAFIGTDSFTVTVSDGKGGTAVQFVTVLTASLPTADDWRLFTETGWMGEIGGSGKVLGTGGFQDVGVFNVPGHVQFDGSFGKGGDVVRPAGMAADWMVFRQGANAVFSDGDTHVTIPVGTAGMALLFDDGQRLLAIDNTGTMRVGSQIIDNTLRVVSSVPEGFLHPVDIRDSADARLYFAEGGVAWLGGDIDVYGTNGAEQVSVRYGSVTLDASFARGGDFLQLAADFSSTRAQLSGSTVAFGAGSEAIDVTLSAGTAGLTIDFANGTRTLAMDPVSGIVSLGAQAIASSSAYLTFA